MSHTENADQCITSLKLDNSLQHPFIANFFQVCRNFKMRDQSDDDKLSNEKTV